MFTEFSPRSSGRRRWPVALLAASTMAIGLAACGSDGDSAGGGASAAPASSAGGGSEVAQRIATAATESSIYGPAAGPVDAEALTEARAEDIDAFPYEPGGPEKSVVIVSCSPVVGTCVHEAEVMKKTFDILGIKSRIVTSRDYSPAATQSAWNDALASNPDAIVGIGTVGSSIGPQLARAKSRGIFTMYLNGTEKSGENFDSYVAGGWTLGQVTLAAQMVVAGEGETVVSWLDVPLFPDLGTPDGISFLKENCPGCSVKTGEYTSEEALDPVKIQQLTSSTIRANPKIDFLALASADGQVNAAAQAIRTSGNPDVKLAGVGLTADAQASLSSGDLPFIVGSPQNWVALQGVDGILRGLAGEAPLAPEELKIGVYVMTKDNAPDNPKFTFGPLDRWAVEQFDFVTPYAEAWNVDLSSVARDQK